MKSIVVTVVALWASLAWGWTTGSDLQRECTGGNTLQHDAREIGCYNYLRGMFDMYEVLRALDVLQPMPFCAPDAPVEASQMRSIVLKWLREHPERLHQPAGWLVYLAYAGAFPCRGEPSPVPRIKSR